MKTGKAIHILLIAVIAAIMGSHLLLNSKKLQQDVAGYAGTILAETLGTEVFTSNIELAHPCGISVNDLLIYDHLGDTLISASKAVVQFRILPLLKKKMDITRISLINPYVNIYRQDLGSATNLGSTLVHVSSAVPEKKENNLILRANSVYIKNGKFKYNVIDQEETPNSFNSSHILLDKITTTISLKYLSTDSINARLRKLAVSDHSGLSITNMNGAIRAGRDNVLVNNLIVSANNSKININRFEAFNTPSGFVWNIGMFSSVKGSDFSALLPQAETIDNSVSIALAAEGNEKIYNINQFDIVSEDKSFDIGITASVVNNNDGTAPYSINDFSIDKGVILGKTSAELHTTLTEQLSGFGIAIPGILANIGESETLISLDGNIDKLNAVAEIASSAGNAKLSIKSNNKKQNVSVLGSNIELGRLLSNNKLGRCSLQMNADGNLLSPSLKGAFSGNISSFTFNNYVYNNISVDGSLLNDTIRTSIAYNDSNANILAEAKVLPDATDTYTAISLNLKEINLTNLNLSSRDSMIVSANIVANSIGNTIDDLRGKLTIDSLSYCDLEGEFKTNEQILLTIEENGYNRRDVFLKSNIANIDIVGDYKLSTLPNSFVMVLDKTLPTLSEWLLQSKLGLNTIHNSTDRFVVDIQLPPTNFYENVLHIPLELGEAASIQYSVNGNSNTANVTALIPDVSVNDNYIRNGNITLDSNNGKTNINLAGNYSAGFNPGNNIIVSLSAANDSIKTNVQWNSVNKDELNINTTALTIFEEFNRQNDWIKSRHQLSGTGLTLNNVDWNLSQFYIATDSGKISIDNFKLANKDQSISADGLISSIPTDSLHISFDNIDLENTFNMFNVGGVSFKGIASADIHAISLLETPAFFGNLTADNFSYMGSYGGHLEIEGIWNQELECIDINALMNDEDKATTLFEGYYSPKNRFIDINIDANRTDLYFLNTFTKNIFREVNGKAIGNIRLFGGLQTLDLEGTAILEDGVLDQSVLNTRFIIRHDTLTFQPGKMIFRDVEFYDERGNKGLLMCNIDHTDLIDFAVNLDAYITNMQVLNIPKTESTDLFANVFATGSINLTTSNSKGLIVKADATTAPGTTFGYNLSAGPVADNSFLKIVDANSVAIEIKEDITEKKRSKKRTKEVNTDVQLSFNIDCTDDAEIELLMDPLNGTVRGSGQIRADYSNKQGVSLLGRYNVTNGLCNFSLENLIRKDFKFSDSNDSYVTFNGHPSTAELNLHTIHTVNSASLSDLDVNLSSDNNVRVNCLMDISGTVTSPSLAFNIELPQGSQEEKEAIKSSTSTEEQTNLQFMYLLTMGRFYSYDYANTNVSTSPSAMESFFNNTVNTQINNLLSQVINNNNFTLSGNVTAGSYLNNDPANLTDKEFEGIMEAHLLNNRLLLNGNFGYRENAITNTSNLISDFEVEWLLFKKPRISLRGYNKNNDKYFSKTSLTTQGVGIVYEADF